MSGFGFNSVGFVGSLSGGAVAPAGPLVLSEASPQIRYSGNWVSQTFADYVDGAGSYATAVGSYYEITVPSGYTRAVFDGILNANGATFNASRNGAVVGSGDQSVNGNGFSDALGHIIYFSFTGVVAGDVLRLTMTGGVALFADRITLSA